MPVLHVPEGTTKPVVQPASLQVTQEVPAVRRVMRLRSRLPLALLALLIVVQLFNPSPIWMGLLLGLAAMLAASFLWARELRDRLFARRLIRGAWVVVGDMMTETFVVENRSPLPVLWAEIVDHSDLPGYRPDWVATLGGHSQQSYRAESRCQRRGVFTLGPWEIRASDPLGWFSVLHEFSDTRSILVYPRAMHLPDLQLPRGDAPGPSHVSRRTPQFTTAVATVRPYLPGDSLRRIHWRRTAHHETLMVKEFDLEPSGDLWIVLDLDARVQAGTGAESTVEYGVTLAASLAAQMLAENRRVGLAAFGQEPFLLPPQASELQLWRILEALAHAEVSDAVSLSGVLRDLRQTVGRGRTIVVITAACDPAWPAELLYLARQGNAPAALLLDAASFRSSAGRDEQAATLEGLRQVLAEQGVPSHVIDRSFVFRPLYRIARRRTELRTLAATGRVIAVEVEELV